MLGAGLISIKKSDWGRSRKQEKNMKKAIRFFWFNIILVIVINLLQGIFVYRTMDDITDFNYMQALVISPLSMVASFAFFLCITLPIWRLCNRRSRDLVLLYFILTFIIPLILSPISFGLYFLGIQSINIFIGISFSIILMISSIMSKVILIFVYTKIVKMIEVDEKKDEDPLINGWEWIKKRFSLMMRKPFPVILVLVVIGILIGSSSEYAYQSRYENEVKEHEFSDFESSVVSEGQVELEDTNYLKESSREKYGIDPERSIRTIEVHLSWQDEEPDEMELNEPDNFTLWLEFSNSSGEQSMEQEGVSGSLSIQYQFEDEMDGSLNNVKVIVDMNRAGDIMDPPGITILSQDEGNEYDLRVNFEYFDNR